MDKSGLEHKVDVTKGMLELLRELLILLLLFALLFLPSTVRSIARNLGITSFSTPIGDFELGAMNDSTREVATSVATASEQIAETRAQLRALTSSASPQRQPELHALVRQLDSSEAKLRIAGTTVSRVLLRQQAALAQVRPTALPTAGWLYVGQVDQTRSAWVGAGPQNIMPSPPRFRAGDTVAVRNDTYLRGETATSQRNEAPVLMALQPQTRVVVQDVDYARARRGGWFVWLRVRLVP